MHSKRNIKFNNYFKFKKNLNFLGYKTIIKDIKDLPRFYQWMFLIIGVIVTFFSFFDIDHFINPLANPSIWSITNQLNTTKIFLGNMPKWVDATLYTLSGLASFTGIVNVFLVSFGKMSNYFWGVINATITTLFSFDYGYTGDAQLYLFIYLPTQFIGWYLWEISIDKKNNRSDISTIKFKDSNAFVILSITAIAISVLSIGWYFEIPALHHLITNSDYAYLHQPIPHSFDAIENGIGISAQILMILKYKEQWTLWIVSNIITLSMYCGVSSIGSHGPVNINVSMIIELLFFLIDSFIGLFIWHNKMDSKTGKWIKKKDQKIANHFKII